MLKNTNISTFLSLEPPSYFLSSLPITNEIENLILKTRIEIENIIQRKSKKLLFIVGPCSIHDPDAALEYGKKLKELADQVSDKILIVMRVYFEKPRTTTGWKGLINDPNIDDTFQIDKGVHIARSLMIQLNEMGLGVATEALDPIMPEYLGDLTSWTAIGARTAESQTHR